MTTFLIGYDIANKKRLMRVYKETCHFACPIEESVFVFSGSYQHLIEKIKKLLDISDLKKDDIRCYELPSRGIKSRYGKSPLPLGVIWSGMPLL